MKVGGRYITCGYKTNTPTFLKMKMKTPNHLKNIMLKVMLNNLSLIGNCIGTWEDLEKVFQIIMKMSLLFQSIEATL